MPNMIHGRPSARSTTGTIEFEPEKTHFLWLDWPTTKLEWLDRVAR